MPSLSCIHNVHVPRGEIASDVEKNTSLHDYIYVPSSTVFSSLEPRFAISVRIFSID